MKNRIIGICAFLGVLLTCIAVYLAYHHESNAQQEVQVIQTPVPGEDYVEGDDADHEDEHGEQIEDADFE